MYVTVYDHWISHVFVGQYLPYKIKCLYHMMSLVSSVIYKLKFANSLFIRCVLLYNIRNQLNTVFRCLVCFINLTDNFI